MYCKIQCNIFIFIERYIYSANCMVISMYVEHTVYISLINQSGAVVRM